MILFVWKMSTPSTNLTFPDRHVFFSESSLALPSTTSLDTVHNGDDDHHPDFNEIQSSRVSSSLALTTLLFVPVWSWILLLDPGHGVIVSTGFLLRPWETGPRRVGLILWPPPLGPPTPSRHPGGHERDCDGQSSNRRYTQSTLPRKVHIKTYRTDGRSRVLLKKVPVGADLRVSFPFRPFVQGCIDSVVLSFGDVNRILWARPSPSYLAPVQPRPLTPPYYPTIGYMSPFRRYYWNSSK